MASAAAAPIVVAPFKHLGPHSTFLNARRSRAALGVCGREARRQRNLQLRPSCTRAHAEVDSEAAEASADCPEDHFRAEATLRDGQRVTFRRLGGETAEAVTDLLADSFSTAIGAREYRNFLRRRISTYVGEMLASPPQVTSCLVCMLPDSATAGGDDDSGGDDSDAGGETLVGTCEASLVVPPSTKHIPSLRVPTEGDTCYVSNMTVAPAFRRRGVGTAMLSTLEAFALYWRPMGCDVYLHVRLMDQPARALYANNGYEVVATDHFAVFRGERRTSLMRKRLAASPEAMAAAAARDAAVAARAAAAAASVTEAAEQEEEDGEETAASPVPI